MNSKYPNEPDPDAIKMFAGQIPRYMDESDLQKLFEEFGPVYQINVLRDKVTNQSKGCCFVTFYTRRAAMDAQSKLHNIKILPGMQHPIQMKPADSEKRVEERKLFVGMLSKKCTENDVRMMFAQFGTIEECTVLREQNGQSRGCAFVTLSSRQSAQNAIRTLHHSRTLEGCRSPLVVKLADSQKEKEMKRLQQMQAQLLNGAGAMGLGALGQQYLALLQQTAGASSGALGNLGNMGLGLNALQMQQLINAASGSMPSQNSYGDSGSTNLQSLQNLQNLAALAAFASNSTTGTGNSSSGVGQFAHMSNNTSSGAASGSSGASGSVYSVNTGSGMGTLGQAPGGTSSKSMVGGVMTGANGCSPSGAVGGAETLGAQTYSGMQQYGSAGLSSLLNPGPDGANLFIYHLPQEFTDFDLSHLFSPFGNVLSSKVYIDKQTNLSKCFGFVSYDNPSSAQQAIHAMNGYQIGAKRLKVHLKRQKNDGKLY